MLDLKPSGVDSIYITQAFQSQTAKLSLLVYEANVDSIPSQLEEDMREIEETLFSSWGIPVAGRMRIRRLPGGSLLHFRTSGIYIPHAFEGHIDDGLHPLQQPFTLAHEMAHGYGLTDESECNFVAYLACMKSPNVSVRFSAELAYWRYLAGYFRKLDPEGWPAVYNAIDPAILEHLKSIREHVDRYSDWLTLV